MRSRKKCYERGSPFVGGIRENSKEKVLLISAKPAFLEVWNTCGSVMRDDFMWTLTWHERTWNSMANSFFQLV